MGKSQPIIEDLQPIVDDLRNQVVQEVPEIIEQPVGQYDIQELDIDLRAEDNPITFL